MTFFCRKLSPQALFYGDQGLKGKLFSVFPHSFLILLNNGELLTFLQSKGAGGGGGGPNYFVLSLSAPVNFQALGLKPDLGIVFQDKRLLIPELSLVVDLKTAESWQPPEPPLVIEEELAKGVKQLGDFLKAALLHISFTPPNLLSLITERFFKLLTGLIGKNKIKFRLAKILGLGDGFTPAGDDLLLGFIAAINRLRKGKLPQSLTDFQDEMASFLAANPQITTFASFKYLQYALSGNLSENICQTLDRIITGNPSPASFNQILNLGHDSGFFILQGAYFAFLIYLEKENELLQLHPEKPLL